MEKFITVNENIRTYHYNDGFGSTRTYRDVVGVHIDSSGQHRLNLKDGQRIIILPGFIAIGIYSADDWVF